jgi:tetratricopeptide (TPR) repeat protein
MGSLLCDNAGALRGRRCSCEWISVKDGTATGTGFYPLAVHDRRIGLLTLTGDWEQSERRARDGLRWAERSGRRSLIARCHTQLAHIVKKRGRYPEAAGLYREASRCFEAEGDHAGQGAVQGGLGDINYYLSEYQQAIDCYQVQLTAARQAGDREMMAQALQAIGVVCKRQGKYELALQYQRQSLEIATAAGNRQAIGRINGNIGTIYTYLEQYDQAMPHYRIDLEIAEELGDRQAAAAVLGNIGNIYANYRDYQRSLDYYHRSESIFEQLGDKRALVINRDALASIYLALGRFGRARDYLEREMPLIDELGDKVGRVLALGHWGELHAALDEPAAAEDCLRRAIAAGKRIELAYYPSSIVYNLAELYWRTGRSAEAAATCREALQMLQQDRRDALAYSCRMLGCRIGAAHDRPAAVAELQRLLAGADGDDQRAEALLSLHRVAGGGRYREDAAQLYRTLWQQCPLEQYRRALSELSSDGPPPQEG